MSWLLRGNGLSRLLWLCCTALRLHGLLGLHGLLSAITTIRVTTILTSYITLIRIIHLTRISLIHTRLWRGTLVRKALIISGKAFTNAAYHPSRNYKANARNDRENNALANSTCNSPTKSTAQFFGS